MEPWQIWLIAAALLAAIEVMTTSFFMLWFAIGAVAAGVAALVGAELAIQGSVFVLVSLLLVLFTRPLISKFVKLKDDDAKTNLEGLPGRNCVALEDFNRGLGNHGLVKLGGDIWSAISINDQIITKGDQLKVVRVEGVKLIVEKNKEG